LNVHTCANNEQSNELQKVFLTLRTNFTRVSIGEIASTLKSHHFI